MLTILAWMVFIPAVVWNFAMLIVVFTDIVGSRKIDWLTARNMFDLSLNLAILFIPGVYLFGWI